jgi:hypothetical protein
MEEDAVFSTKVQAMKRKVLLELVLVFGVTQIGNAAWLRLQWRDLGPDDAEIGLALGETAIVDIYFEMSFPEESLAEFSLSDEPSPLLTQTGTEAISGWTDLSIGGPLGIDDQSVHWVARPGLHISGSGEYLIGSQIIRNDNEPLGLSSITIDTNQLHLIDELGSSYEYAPRLAGIVPQFFGIGLGSPPSPFTPTIDWNPLIVRTVPEPGGLGFLSIGVMFTIRGRKGRGFEGPKRLDFAWNS